ncbi:alpha-E domain-containing protein [Thalassococcus sp. CAU 1522]|uniref:Alpha-E domain-containing protein n=1 Tax=Thalassococcus arenae TaxID=2851652 RepID=A0ABS6N3K3_9RHOB|nr:alpha-E domain-containing protein [Thalassococcus arenae]MBV2358598.1 alpha-E domain-containing protein [Thalassococcus arenae]
MLGRTANGLFWMYRYLERAENTARLIETGQRIALTRLGQGDEEWGSVLQSAGALTGFDDAYDELTKDNAIDWLLRNLDNPSSVRSCIAAARQNARMVRTAITGDVWSATNAAHMTADRILARKVSERDLPETLRRLRENAALVRGVTLGTMLRNDIFDFLRLGTFLERADNTARILDVKYYVLLPSPSAVGTSLDNVQWESILRSLSARGGFRMEYGARGGPREIAQFLLLDPRMPRSMVFCIKKLCTNLSYLRREQDGMIPALDLAEAMRSETLSCSIDAIFDAGLHEFLQDAQQRLAAITRQIEIDFRFYE